MRLAAGYGVLVALLALAAWLLEPPREPQTVEVSKLVATRDLPMNHLLVAGDLRFHADPMHGVAGTYVTVAEGIRKGATLAVGDTAKSPNAWPPGEVLWLAVSLARDELTQGANAGRTVPLCLGSSRRRIADAVIRVVRCGGPKADCTALVELPPVPARKVAARLSKSGRSVSVCPS